MADSNTTDRKALVTLGMFIIDQFVWEDEHGNHTGRESIEQIGGGGTYAIIGARIWLPPSDLGMIVDRGHDFPSSILSSLNAFSSPSPSSSSSLFHYRDDPMRSTTRGLNLYKGELRGFEYLNPRVRISPAGLPRAFARPRWLHSICGPARFREVQRELRELGWAGDVRHVYEPIPGLCNPGEMPALREALKEGVDVLSPNHSEAAEFMGLPEPNSREGVEDLVRRFHKAGARGLVIRSGAMGAAVSDGGELGVRWVQAYHTDPAKVVDVTGAGNAFLGGLAAGLELTNGDLYEAALYASVSASYTIEQMGLPSVSVGADGVERWNRSDTPAERLEALRKRQAA